METFILVVHVLLAVGIIGLIMLQQGKGAEMGASFGSGSSQTVFGAAGSGNFFSRMTGILAAIFFVTSLALAVVAKKSSVIDSDYLPAAEAQTEAVIGEIDDSAAALEDVTEQLETDAASALEEVEAVVGDAEAKIDTLADEAEAAAGDAEKSVESALKALDSATQNQ